MGMVSLPPAVCDTNLSQRISFENNNNNNNNNNLREASFSSYLNHAEKEFVRKLAESTRDQSKPPTITNITTTQEEDGDIEVFGAEKYFNGGVDGPKPNSNPVKFQSGKPRYKKTETGPKSSSNRLGTPSIRSESSINSQNALLQRKTPSGAKKNKNKSSSQVKGFLYKCSCCYKNDSIKVDEDIRTKTIIPKQPMKPTSLNLGLIPDPKNPPLKMHIQVEDQKDRKSIEVFGSNSLKPTKNPLNLEERLSILSWNDITPRVKESNNNNNNNIPTKIYNELDGESDASSDLFEIESLIMENPNSFLTRQGSDCTDCVTPTTCYAPSEASIEWSVITASAADFPIMTSDYDDRRISMTSPVRNVVVSAMMNDVKENMRRRSNGLMGCKSQKAVRVAGAGAGVGGGDGQAMSCDMAQIRQRTDSFGRLTRFEAEAAAKVIGFNQSQRQHGLGLGLPTNSIPRQYSPRIPNILYF